MDDVTPEHWLPVVGWEGFYEVSDFGRVRSLSHTARTGRRFDGKVRTLYLNPRDGYWRVTLSGGGRRSGPVLVHRLLMEAFTGPCPEGEETRHLDGNRANCVLSNLAYGTHDENMQDMIRHGTNYWANKTHCPKDHEYTPENTYIIPNSGSRACKQCWKRAA